MSAATAHWYACTIRKLIFNAVVVVVGIAIANPCIASSALYNGFLLRALPAAYAAQERFIHSLSDTGANTIIIELPQKTDGNLDDIALANAVYLVHQAKLRIFVIMPTRGAKSILSAHPQWEDRGYDLAEDEVNDTGKLDLFRSKAVESIAEMGKTVASYAVDGILLGRDFEYDLGGGLGKAAVSELEPKLKKPISVRRLFEEVDRSKAVPLVTKYGEEFLLWTEAKRNRLVTCYEAVRSAARTVNPAVKVGVPVPIMLPVAVPDELLYQHAFDEEAYRRISVDLFWTEIDHRGAETGNDITYSEGLQLLSRSAYAAISSVHDIGRMIVVLRATSDSGRPLPLTEIEESTNLVRHAGKTGIVYSVVPGAVPSKVLMHKMFR